MHALHMAYVFLGVSAGTLSLSILPSDCLAFGQACIAAVTVSVE